MATQTVVELSKHFGKVKAVNGVSFHVENGEFLCILGPSGCGKSTILRMIAGFEEPTSGDIRIDDVSVLRCPPTGVRRPWSSRSTRSGHICASMTTSPSG